MATLDPETRFYDALRDLFVGAELEGESGYVNLMRIKSKYFNKIFLLLKNDINEKIREFPEFKKELYEKLYSFFKKYFSETGSIYFRKTPFNERIYEKIYTDNRDVVMFWKTHMLYYVKTDIQAKSLKVTIDNIKFYFDASKLQHKKAWEKRELIYTLKEVRRDGTIVFNVSYSERGRKTDVEKITRELRKKGKRISVDILERAFRVFEKQNEIDYFINKNAKQFLREQFDLWLYQYIYTDETMFTEYRIKQLKILKDIAYKIIDLISQFEDELVKIWRKPKFVLNSNYVITLDRIYGRPGGLDVVVEIVDRLVDQKNIFNVNIEKYNKIKNKNKNYKERFEEAGEITNQITEWYLLDLIDEKFNPKHIITTTLTGEKTLNPKYKFLPIDTRYFKDLEPRILALFDNLDEELDGWLIKSENWQALNTILPKFKEKIQAIYIDPPFNTGTNEFTMYINKFLDSAWITMMENRLTLAKELLKETGSIFVRIDYHGNHYTRFLLDDIFGKENFRNEIAVSRTKTALYANVLPENPRNLSIVYDNIYWYSKSEDTVFPNLSKGITPQRRKAYWKDFKTFYDRPDKRYEILGVTPEPGCSWLWKKEEAMKALENYRRYLEEAERTGISLEEYWEKTGRRLRFIKKEGNTIKYWVEPISRVSNNNWTDLEGYSRKWGFPTENSEPLLKRVIGASSNRGDLVLDFFLGSGTTTAVAHKLGRRWIGIEMGEHFYTVVLPRMKKVLAYDPSGISRDADVREGYNRENAGGFFKYYELEQYEDVLRRARYVDDEPFFDPTRDPYNQYIFMKDLKFLEVLEIDYEKGEVKVNLDKLYKNVDIAETLSNLHGKRIKTIRGDSVVLVDDNDNEYKIYINNLDYKKIKPLIWW